MHTQIVWDFELLPVISRKSFFERSPVIRSMIRTVPACSMTHSLPFPEAGAPAHMGRSRPLMKGSERCLPTREA